MDEDEATRRAAEHKVAALHHVGWEMGTGATVWARVVQDELALHESARERYAANTADLETWERLHGTAVMLVMAIDQVLVFEHRVRCLTGDAELAKARERFDAVCPDAEELRDLVTHLDEYAVGRGQRQKGARMPPLDDPYLATFVYWGDGGGTIVNLGDRTLNLRMAASAATELAQVVERVRARHLQRAKNDANAALRHSFGLPPE